MKKIIFLRRHGVYLPEINAYINYLQNNFLNIEAYDSLDIVNDFSETDFDIVWKFMGFDLIKNSSFVVHEYGSLSLGLMPRIKNFIKKTINTKPSLRVFLNRAVKAEMGFHDNVPNMLREMGVSTPFFRGRPNPNPEFDYVYSGSLNRGKTIISLLNHFKTLKKGEKLLVVGSVPDIIHNTFGMCSNIYFTGKLKYEEVPDVISNAKYGLNAMPNIYPYNLQTSTKVLEYCAARLPVISTRYTWIEDFEKKSRARFFYTQDDFSNLSLKNLDNHEFLIPDVKNYHWDTIIQRSGIFDFLKQASE